MIIIYYRDADGKIVRAHTAPEDWTMETAQERIDQFNSETRLQPMRSRQRMGA